MLWPPKPYEHPVREKQKKRNLIKKKKKRKMETKEEKILVSYIHIFTRLEFQENKIIL